MRGSWIMFNNYKSLYQKSMLINEGLVDDLNKYKMNPFLKEDKYSKLYKEMLVQKDRVLCSNRFKWLNLPNNLTSEFIESMLYQWGSLLMFEDDDGTLIFSRYSHQGKLNVYGQMEYVQPIDHKGKAYGKLKSVINTHGKEAVGNVGVILQDFTMAYTASPRLVVNAGTTIADQVRAFAQMRTNILLSIKKALAICENEEQKRVVTKQVIELLDPDTPVVAISAGDKGLGKIVEMFNFASNFDCQNYTHVIEYLDRVRRSYNGIPAPDPFEKKERKISSEDEYSQAHTNLILLDGLQRREDALKLFKKYAKNTDNMNIEIELNETLEEVIYPPESEQIDTFGGGKDV